MDQITLDILWSRLVATVNEQAAALMRSSFTSIVRESGDLSAGVFDRRGRMVAQAVTGTPGHINSMATGMIHFLDALPGRLAPARRRPRHQRPLEDRLPAERHHGGHAGLPRRPRRRALRQHVPRPRHRRARPLGGRPLGVRGGPRHPDDEAPRRGAARRAALRDDRGQRAHARGSAGRPPLPGRRQRGRRPAAHAVPGRVRPRRHRGPGRRDHRALGAGDARAHRRPPRRRVPLRAHHRRLRAARSRSARPSGSTATS